VFRRISLRTDWEIGYGEKALFGRVDCRDFEAGVARVAGRAPAPRGWISEQAFVAVRSGMLAWKYAFAGEAKSIEEATGGTVDESWNQVCAFHSTVFLRLGNESDGRYLAVLGQGIDPFVSIARVVGLRGVLRPTDDLFPRFSYRARASEPRRRADESEQNS
jgi:hypothetical protein